jgi:hypothetical protein
MKPLTCAAAGLLAIVMIAAAGCGDDNPGGDSPASATPNGGIPVALMQTSPGGTETLGTFEDQVAAAEEASERAGFEVRPVANLPEGFAVVAFMVRAPGPPGQPNQAEVIVHSDSGGMSISQAVGSHSPGPNAVRLDAPGIGDGTIYRVAGPEVSYHLLTADRTYAIALGQPDAVTEDEAIQILAGFLL